MQIALYKAGLVLGSEDFFTSKNENATLQQNYFFIKMFLYFRSLNSNYFSSYEDKILRSWEDINTR